MVRDVKITVLETKFHRDHAEKYGVEGLGPCPCNKPGQVYISHGGLKPEGLCDDAWLAFERFVFAMAHGTDEFFPDWIRVPKTTINCWQRRNPSCHLPAGGAGAGTGSE